VEESISVIVGSVVPGAPRRSVRRWAPWLLLLAAGGPLFFWRLGSHDLWPPDEPRFGLVAREMRARGDYIVLSRNDQLYTDKPPLFFWAINGFGALRGGVDEWAARLPSAVASLLTLGLIVFLGRLLYDARTGWLAAALFATSAEILVRSRWASIDMTLNLFALAAIVLLWMCRTRAESSPSLARLAWVSMAFATLAKGPVGLVLPLLAVLPAILAERDLRAARRIVPPSGVGLFLAITLSWFALFAWRLGWGDAIGITAHQTVERYVDAWNGRHPVWYYLWQFPVGFLPWSVFLPWACWHAFAGEPESGRRRAARFLTFWIATIFIFFSFSTGKRGVYIIPLYPAAAILVARLLARASESGDAARLLRRRLWVPLVVWCGLAAALALTLPPLAARRALELRAPAITLGAILLAGGLGALILNRRGRVPGAASAIVASTAAAALLAVHAVVPWVNGHENIRGFAEDVRARLAPEIPFATTEQKREAWVFYIGRHADETDTREQVLDYLSKPPPRDLLVEERILDTIRDDLPAGIVELLRGRVAGQDYYLLRREPVP
jgi:4-amino-4-deoxy-L-arabinose transferase-like glycosyltransferase